MTSLNKGWQTWPPNVSKIRRKSKWRPKTLILLTNDFCKSLTKKWWMTKSLAVDSTRKREASSKTWKKWLPTKLSYSCALPPQASSSWWLEYSTGCQTTFNRFLGLMLTPSTSTSQPLLLVHQYLESSSVELSFSSLEDTIQLKPRSLLSLLECLRWFLLCQCHFSIHKDSTWSESASGLCFSLEVSWCHLSSESLSTQWMKTKRQVLTPSPISFRTWLGTCQPQLCMALWPSLLSLKDGQWECWCTQPSFQ